MNRNKIVAAVTAFAFTIVGAWAWGGIEGSKHDFSNKDWSGGDACSACHSAKGEQPTAAPLWDENADLNRTFGTPLSRSKEAGPGTTLCLRCHDGTIARDTITGEKRKRFVGKQNPGLFSAGHDTSDHPVGVEYPQFDKGYRPVTSVIAKGTVPLPDGKVECISCHDPHNMSGLDHMLVASNARSALCLTCHRK
ncbi:MAG: cytochrome c3 family protein [Phycisphaerae bacterium]